ncbi:MAG: outer membrane lipoprotein carrier protein LolA [Deltaproteobacteria bacterium]|nr:outer membrane lipoprotein carrier protein LolA [Deltaproteobacteria bacterium]
MMKRGVCRFFSVILVLVTAGICLGWADTWEGIRGATGTIRTIRADFVQEKHLSILSRPFISKGVFYYQAPDSLRWEYTSPVRSILLMHKGRMRGYTETGGGLMEDSRMDPKGMQIILQEIALWLGGRFSDDPAFDAVLKDGRRIVLTPKEKGFSKMIQHIDLNLSETPGIIESVEIYEDSDSFTRLEFLNTDINKEIEEALFKDIS